MMNVDRSMDAAIQKLTLFSDPLAKLVFSDKRAAEYMIRILLDRDDLVVESVNTQYSLANLHGHSVIYDVFATDSAGTQYNVEIQQANDGAVPERARYYSSILDANILKPDTPFKQLPETYVIFLTLHDVLGGNEPIYHIDRMIRETGNPFGDRAHIIYVNGENVSRDTALGRLMHDFQCADAADIYSSYLRELVHQYKDPAGGGYMKVCNELKDFAAEWKIEGIQETVLKAVNVIMKTDPTLSVEEALQRMDVPETDWQYYIDQLSK